MHKEFKKTILLRLKDWLLLLLMMMVRSKATWKKHSLLESGTMDVLNQ